jgi:hypothetical protein
MEYPRFVHPNTRIIMSNKLLVAALALSLAPVALAAQQDPETRVQTALDQAAASGIPTALLEARVAEGRAKGIPMDRIAAAVERRAASLARANEVLSGTRGLSEADLAAGADAIEAGIESAAIRSVIQQARSEDRPVAIAVLTFLHGEQGLPVDQALAKVTEALSRGPDALRSLPSQARGRGGAPGSVPAGPPAGVPAPGGRPGGDVPQRPVGGPGGG